MKNQQATTMLVSVMLLAGVGVGGYFAYSTYTRKHPKAATGQPPTTGSVPNPYAPKPYVPTEQLGIKPLPSGSPALSPTLAPSVDAVLADMQAKWTAQLGAQQAQLEAQYQADLAKQTNAREAEMLKLQRESAAREAELMKRQEEELRRQQELVRQAEQSRQRELETLRRQEEERKATEAARHQDRLTTLNSQLSDVQGQIRLTEVKLNTLNSSQPDPAFLESVRAMLERQCRQHFGVFGIGCENPKQHEMDARVPVEWEKKKAADRAPLTEQLNSLRQREQALLADISSLGGKAGGYGYAGGVTQPGPVGSRLFSVPNNLSTMVAVPLPF